MFLLTGYFTKVLMQFPLLAGLQRTPDQANEKKHSQRQANNFTGSVSLQGYNLCCKEVCLAFSCLLHLTTLTLAIAKVVKAVEWDASSVLALGDLCHLQALAAEGCSEDPSAPSSIESNGANFQQVAVAARECGRIRGT
jgi:hypothetical protein